MLLPALSSVNLLLSAGALSGFDTLPVDKVFFECDDALALLLALRWRTGGRWGQATVRGSDEWSAST